MIKIKIIIKTDLHKQRKIKIKRKIFLEVKMYKMGFLINLQIINRISKIML